MENNCTTYFTTWPIPLHTSKQNIKNPSSLRSLAKRLLNNNDGPILVLAIHLCGTLSIQALILFYSLLQPQAKFSALKPCCLPGMAHVRAKENFDVVLGNNDDDLYRIPTCDVCAPGRFRQSTWQGPVPRWQLQGKFETWCTHLHQAMQTAERSVPTESSDTNYKSFPVESAEAT